MEKKMNFFQKTKGSQISLTISPRIKAYGSVSFQLRNMSRTANHWKRSRTTFTSARSGLVQEPTIGFWQVLRDCNSRNHGILGLQWEDD